MLDFDRQPTPRSAEETELETVSLDDFKTEEEPVLLSPTIHENEEIEEEEEIAAAQDAAKNSGLVFAIPDSDYEENTENTFSADAFKEYNESFSLISHNHKNNGRHNSSRGFGSPVILILACVVLCLLAIIAYYLLVKPTQAGITVGENFNNLFSFALKVVYKPW